MAILDKKKAEDSFPTVLNENGETITSQRKIAETMAKHFSDKVRKITDTFDKDQDTALKILES